MIRHAKLSFASSDCRECNYLFAAEGSDTTACRSSNLSSGSPHSIPSVSINTQKFECGDRPLHLLCRQRHTEHLKDMLQGGQQSVAHPATRRADHQKKKKIVQVVNYGMQARHTSFTTRSKNELKALNKELENPTGKQRSTKY